MLTMRRYIPANIDISQLDTSKIKNYHPDKMISILAEIFEKPVRPSGYVEVHSKRLQYFVHNYKEYLESLSTSGTFTLSS